MRQKKKRQYLAVATGILVVTAVLRLVSLQDVPPGLARDETLNADIASFILDGRHALFFREGYGHEALYHYIGALFQALMGDNFLAIRLPSVFSGLLMVAATMTLARQVGRRMGGTNGGYLTAVLTGLFLAVSWWPIILSRVGLRPILFPLILVLALLNWEKRPWLAGFLLGLTTYSYTAARAVLVLPFVMLVYLFLFRKRLEIGRSQLQNVLFIGLIALLVYLPLGLTLRADPTLQERVNQLSGPLEAAREGDLGPLLETTTATLGVFTFTGDPLSSYALPDVPLFGPLMGLFFYGGLLLCLLRIGRHPQYGLLLIWLGVTMLPSAAAADAPSLIRLVGAMPVVYMLPALAGQWVYQWAVGSGQWAVDIGRLRVWRQVAVVFVVVLLVGVNLRATVVGGFGEWVGLDETRQKYQSIWLDIGRYWSDNGLDSGAALVVADSWYEPVKADSLRRDVGQELEARWVQQGRAIVYPAGESPSFYVPEFAPPLPLLWETAGLGQPLYRSESFPSFAVYQPAPLNSLEQSVEVMFIMPGPTDTRMTLLGWQTVWRPETAELELLTHWLVEDALPWDTTIFAHLRDESGQAVAQQDSFDAAPLRLQPGDELLQLQSISVPDSLDAYRLVIGLYNRESAVRWLTPAGERLDSFFLLTEWPPEAGS